MFETTLKIIPTLTALFAAIWALILFNRQQRFKRMQNLSTLWKTFFNSDDLLRLFNLMNEIESDRETSDKLASTASDLKLKYLAVIEEISLYVSEFEVDKKYASYLFQWHFHFVYGSSRTANAFWSNLGGVDEMKAAYWSKSRELAAQMTPQS